MSLVQSLQWPLGQTAAAFFLNNFVVKGPVLSDTNHDLLVGICRDHSESAAPYAIEAVGLAGLSNVHRDHHLRVEARKRYGRALTKTNCSLSDPTEATSDLTAMAVLFLGQFESMVVESWDQYSRAHIDGALALLKLRGRQQCEREIGVRLFLAFRSQILADCMQRELPVPGSLLEAGKALDNSPIERPRSSNVSIGDIYVRYVDVIAAIKASWPLGHEDMQRLSEEVDDLDATLQAWRQGIHPQYNYTTVHVTTITADDIPDLPSTDATKGRRHIYQNEWSADIWNKWRVICVQSLIWPLYIVAQEVLNDYCIRKWAIEQLSRINDSIGIRQAALLAAQAQAALDGGRHQTTPRHSSSVHYQPLI
ncbi:hypothetical protein VPNG_09225 [Cytospora leucostoma]|uniref:Uncharacterized protein n=1 Tax=Cytospora leucostoma TaxID=1230097 RepID=A0A423VU83_9PEZI|nr:hypothetical protein VPNG_09225 [Cytospora leucostoma]